MIYNPADLKWPDGRLYDALERLAYEAGWEACAGSPLTRATHARHEAEEKMLGCAMEWARARSNARESGIHDANVERLENEMLRRAEDVMAADHAVEDETDAARIDAASKEGA